MKLILKIEMEISGDIQKSVEINSKIENFLTDLEPLETVKSLTFLTDWKDSKIIHPFQNRNLLKKIPERNDIDSTDYLKPLNSSLKEI
jgi:hypothetical protein